MIPERETTILKTKKGDTIKIREPYADSTRKEINIVLTTDGESFGMVLSADDAREFAVTLKLIAEKILTEAT